MIERILIVVLLAIALPILYRLWVQHQLRRVSSSRAVDPILQGLQPGRPAIVYFTTPGCIPCKVQQQPTLKRITETLGEAIQIVEIDATADPDSAARWGVMSAPTTFVVTPEGRPVAVNHGVASEQKLKTQVMLAIQVN
jgi:thioredoxin-like negative regulator of GroEL